MDEKHKDLLICIKGLDDAIAETKAELESIKRRELILKERLTLYKTRRKELKDYYKELKRNERTL